MIKTLYDVECFPAEGLTWGNKYEANIIKFTKLKRICCFAWKEHNTGKVHWRGLPSYARYRKNKEDFRELLEELCHVQNKSNLLIGHNVKKFDNRQVNKGLILNGLDPAIPYKTVDTLKVARQYFDFESNSLNDLAEFLGVGSKVKHPGLQLWLDCMAGDMKAWALMEKYNKGDVSLNEKIFNKELPFIQNIPSLFPKNREKCRKCHSDNTVFSGVYHNQKGEYKRYKCKNCPTWSLVLVKLWE